MQAKFKIRPKCKNVLYFDYIHSSIIRFQFCFRALLCLHTVHTVNESHIRIYNLTIAQSINLWRVNGLILNDSCLHEMQFESRSSLHKAARLFRLQLFDIQQVILDPVAVFAVLRDPLARPVVFEWPKCCTLHSGNKWITANLLWSPFFIFTLVTVKWYGDNCCCMSMTVWET